MVKYRRNFAPGGVYFFTVVLHDRQSDWLVKYIRQLVSAMKRAQQVLPYKTRAMVVLPDHLHVIWEMPEGDADFTKRWRFIKTQFAKNLRQINVRVEKNRFGENVIWQRRFWEHTIRNEKDYAKHVDYIHYNPVKHKHVARVRDWPYSTFHKYVQQGMLPLDWCYANDDMDED